MNDSERKEETFPPNGKGFGPGFESSTSILIRGEYALITIAIAAYLVWSTDRGLDGFLSVL